MVWGYHAAEPNSYLVITGAGVKGLKLTKKAMVWPFQKVTKISVTPFHFTTDLQAMTSEKLQVCLPAVFTIGPKDDEESLMKYAGLMTDGSSDTLVPNREHIQAIIMGIVEGETRSIVSEITMGELFQQRGIYRRRVVEHVQSELTQFGLHIYNASIKELRDMPGSHYFEFQSKKAHEGAMNQAKTDVAAARMQGDVGEARNVGTTKQEIAKINAYTAVQETERKIEKAKADSKFKSQEIEIERQLNIERIQAERAAELRDADLQKGVQESKALMELERMRATHVTKAKVAKESAAQDADAQLYKARQAAEANAFQQSKTADLELYTIQKQADGHFHRKQRETEAKFLQDSRNVDAKFMQDSKNADASLYRAQQDALGDLKIKTAEAEALYVRHEREAAGIIQLATAYEKLSSVLGGPAGVRDWMMLQSNIPVQLAKANAEAIRGLQPKINVWTTGAQDGSAADSFAPIRNIMQSLPPLFSTIQDQTGMLPPAWMAQMPNGAGGQARNDSVHGSPLAVEKRKGINGS
ncbi:flotillin domain protein [Aureobasidium subglaciale]|nr:flotillin domain protein [Aureobasidium subglaciale]KAI5223733.1 flotillin domain protein [Aureobasidium subglaciale]KAI5227074.1 flotillin domain protein [Aureobasidium subglaciale]KAI5257516.1 flotillin domain protein [Aureobasidium subglaciale]KAI5262616.1 flotillin domain protein [Aureobasidium subglaciale]